MDNAQRGEDSPVPLPVGHIVGTDEVQLALADDTDIHVTAGAQIIVDASCDGISHKLFGFLFLEKRKKKKSCHHTSAGISQQCLST